MTSILRSETGSIRERSLVQKRTSAADMAVSVEGGHMVHSLAYAAHSEDEARSLVRKILRAGLM